MKMCQPHWDALRAAIDGRGLMRLVSGNGEVVAKKLEGQLIGQDEKDTFDPLMAANLAIFSNALKGGGLYLMLGDYCPICESEQHGGPMAEWWINHAADDQLERARELGLTPREQ
jgi:hypothetical protein